jgi:hypothetical protein
VHSKSKGKVRIGVHALVNFDFIPSPYAIATTLADRIARRSATYLHIKTRRKFTDREKMEKR